VSSSCQKKKRNG